MKLPLLWFAGAVVSTTLYLGTTACHYDADTAGRPKAEDGDGNLTSTTYTKEGTGDPKVGSGRGQVGTDAPPPTEKQDAPSK